MTDRDLLELAAKAYWGDEVDDVMSFWWDESEQAIVYTHGDNQDHNGKDVERVWNPLEWSAEALELSVRLHFTVAMRPHEAEVFSDDTGECLCSISIDSLKEPLECVREAIVRAAAEIGRAMG